MPQSYSNPIRTNDLVSKNTFSTTRNPAYKNITIAPGLKLNYPVFDGENPNPIAEMKILFQSTPLSSSNCEYYIYDEDNTNPRVFLETKAPIDTMLLEYLLT